MKQPNHQQDDNAREDEIARLQRQVRRLRRQAPDPGLESKVDDLQERLQAANLRIEFLELWSRQFQEMVANELWPRDQAPPMPSPPGT